MHIRVKMNELAIASFVENMVFYVLQGLVSSNCQIFFLYLKIALEPFGLITSINHKFAERRCVMCLW